MNRERVPMGRRLRRKWKQARRKVMGLTLRALVPILSLIPFSLNRRILPMLTGLLARPLVSKDILHNLDLAYGDTMSKQAKRSIVRSICRNLGYSAAETLALFRGRLPGGSIDAGDTARLVSDVLHEGKGLILVTAHMGNWEALGFHAAEAVAPIPGAAIAKRNANPELQKLAEHAREKTGMATFYQDDSPRGALKHLKEGGFLAVLPDQDMRALSGIFLPFFGRDAYTTIGPATLSVLSGSPMLVVTSFRHPDGLLCTESFPVLRPQEGGSRQEEIERLTRAWSEQVEQSIRSHPSDWMWFHQRWRTTPESLQARKDRLRKAFHAQRKSSVG